MIPRDEEPFDLGRFWNLLRSNVRTIGFFTVLVTTVATVVSLLQPPAYEAETQLLLTKLPADLAPFSSVEAESQIISSDTILNEVIDDLALAATPKDLSRNLRVAVVTDLLVISYRASEPGTARDIATAIAREYLDYREEQALAALVARRNRLNADLTQAKDQLRAMSKRNRSAQSAAQRRILVSRINFLQKSLTQLPVVDAVRQSSGEVVTAANLPISRSSPVHSRNVVLGLIVGLAAGVLVVVARDAASGGFSNRTRATSDLGIPVLTTARFIPKRSVIVWDSPSDHTGDPYRQLRQRLQSRSLAQHKTILMVGLAAGDAQRAQASANLAASIAESGNSVVLVSADLRERLLDPYFPELRPAAGLADWLEDDSLPLRDVLSETRIPNLSILPGGSDTDEIGRELAGARFAQLVAELEAEFEYTVIDSPSADIFADAHLIGSRVPAAIFVVTPLTPRKKWAEVKQDVAQVELDALGAILYA